MSPEQLKASIIQDAIQGKLVEQRPEEGTAEELYQQIQEEKQRLIKEGKVKKEKPLAEITEDEIPFDIPDSWKWVRVCSVGVTQTGNTPQKSHPEYFGNYIPFLGPGDIQNGNVNYDNQGLSEEGKEYGRVTPSDSVLQVCIGGSIGKCALVDREVTFNQQINSIYPLIADSKYVYYVLDSYYFKDYMKENSGGTATPIINRGLWDAIVIPLPPLEEQHRIVAKIEELLPYVDRYAEAYEKLEQFNAKFPEDMKKSILQYAIQGKLVEQRPEEGTAEELYQQIREEKNKLIKEGKIKKEKPLAEISEEEIPFDIPESWKWVKLGDCTSYAQTKEKISPAEILDDMWSLDLEDIQKETGNILVMTKASERKISGDKVRFHKGQVLYSKLRPYLKKILVAPYDGICTPELVPFNTYLIDAEYLVNVLKSPHIDYVINTVTYGVKMPRVGTDTMTNLLIPLPPLEEQRRIVSKINELIPYCDSLKK